MTDHFDVWPILLSARCDCYDEKLAVQKFERHVAQIDHELPPVALENLILISHDNRN